MCYVTSQNVHSSVCVGCEMDWSVADMLSKEPLECWYSVCACVCMCGVHVCVLTLVSHVCVLTLVSQVADQVNYSVTAMLHMNVHHMVHTSIWCTPLV
jgi:hypothetical protein